MATTAIDTLRFARKLKAAGLPDEWEGWGSGFINESVFITSIFESL